MKKIIVRARQLRSAMTDAERALWQVIRNKQLNGFRFRRQHPMGNYIVDFICLEATLILEVDGGQHAEQEDYDLKRTAFLKSLGYRVLRFWNNEVLENIEGVGEVILQALADVERAKIICKIPPSQPSPSRGEGVDGEG